MNHFLPSSDTLWYTPSSMDPPPHQKTFPFFHHHPHHSPLSLSSFKHDDVDSDNHSSSTPTTTTTTDTTSSPSSLDHQYMFEKPLTPSDVGKLNRLVIPKQHAEKYFPLATTTTDSSSTTTATTTAGGGGVLLGFEDESGKCWKFRYSYWNSSQSYVLTKGWSRYVKEKKLDAGDVVLFQRHRFESDRFFIGWRRRGSAPVRSPTQNYNGLQSQVYTNNGAHQQHQIVPFPSSSYLPDCLHAGTREEVREKGRKSGGGNSKRVRLFGVNLECQIEEEDDINENNENENEEETSDGSSLSSQGQGQLPASSSSNSGFPVGPSAYNYFDYVGFPPTHYTSSHMDINFPQDVNQMRNRLR